MSIEQLLFFALILALPLLERLIRAMRARAGDSTAERTHAPAEPTISRPGSSVSVPEVGATPPEERAAELPMRASSPLPPALPREAPHAASEQVRASARETRVRQDRTLGSATSLRVGPGERPLALQRVISGADLRRAIALIAVLGPCRALEPNDVSPLRQ